LRRARSRLPAVKNGIVFSSTGTGSPLRGLRPMRAPRRLTLEGAETAQLDAAATRQGVGDLVEYRRHDQLDIYHPQMRIIGGDVRDEV
jgi:hypothetical protein